MTNNIATVIGFEVVRTLRKKTFWIATLAMPILIIVIYAIAFFASSSAASTASQPTTLSFGYTDESGLVDPQIATAAGGQPVTDEQTGVAQVQTGTLTAYFFFPKTLPTDPVRVYGQDKGVFGNGQYTSLAQTILNASVEQRLADPTAVQLLRSGAPTTTTTYVDGKPTGGAGAIIPPLIFLVLFFLAMVSQGNQMLAAVLEEKENRVTEMILTTIKASRLLIGKLVSLLILGVVQVVVVLVPIVAAILAFQHRLTILGFDLANLVYDPVRLTLGFFLFLGGYALYATSLIAIGTVMPSARDAGPVFSVVIIACVIPLYMLAYIIANPGSTLVGVLTFFPYTATITALLRNGFGSLPVLQGVIAIVILFAVAAVIFALASRLFQYGSISYGKRLDVRAVLSKKD